MYLQYVGVTQIVIIFAGILVISLTYSLLHWTEIILSLLSPASAQERTELILGCSGIVVHVPVYKVHLANKQSIYIREEVVLEDPDHPVSFLTDVTEQSLKAKIAERTQNRLELVLQGTRLGMWDWNPQTNDVVFDDRWAEMLGLKLQDLTQTLDDWQSRVHPEDIEQCFADITAHIEGKVDFYENLHRMMHTDGEWRYILDRGKVVERDEDGNPIRFTGTHTDVTALKLAELRAKDALQARNRFFANMSHELRTPLHGILNIAEFGLDEDAIEDKNTALQRIVGSTKLLSNIVNDILDFSKIEAGKLDIEHIELNLRELVNSVTTPLQQLAFNKGVEVISVVDERVSNKLIGDPVRVTQILNNLCSNAIKFTERGRVEIRVSLLSGGKLKQQIKFEVIDTGVGISEQAQKRLFEEFHQADSSTSRRYGGTGLGLSICTKLSEMINGELTFSSELGKGSVFCYLQSFDIAAQDTLSATPTEKINLLGCRVLVAEDNKVNQVIVRKMLESHNAEVHMTEHGQACFDYFCEHEVDLIFMDIQMPHMDGITATKKIRALAKGSQVPIIAMTANTMKEDIEHYLEVGMDGYLTKPFDKDKLNRLLNIYNPNTFNLKSLAIALSNPKLDNQTKFNSVCKELKRLIPSTNRVSFWQFDTQLSKITCLYCLDENEQGSSGFDLQANDYPAYFEYILGNQVLDASDARANPYTQCFNESYFEPLDIHSLLDFVYLLESKPLGVICCETVGHKTNWTKKDKDSLIKVADVTSLFLSQHIV